MGILWYSVLGASFLATILTFTRGYNKEVQTERIKRLKEGKWNGNSELI